MLVSSENLKSILSSVANKIEGDITTKVSTAKDESKQYTDNAISGVISFDILKVDTLPTEDIKEHTIYLVPIADSTEEDNIYNEYLYIDSKWEHIGTTKVDLTAYCKTTDVDTKIAAATTTMTKEEITAFNASLWS